MSWIYKIILSSSNKIAEALGIESYFGFAIIAFLVSILVVAIFLI